MSFWLWFALWACSVALTAAVQQSFLQVNGTRLSFKGKEVFLSGANQAWINYGCDFGNDQSAEHLDELKGFLDVVANAGGNSMRIWLFTEGDCIPAFDDAGFVIKTDEAGSLTSDLRSYLEYAASKNIFVTIALWNGALMRNQKVQNLFTDDSKMDSFLQVLGELVTGLADLPALAMWEVMNEPEGSLDVFHSVNEEVECYNTKRFIGTQAGWSGTRLKMAEILRFVNRAAAVIHAADSKVLVTNGAWNERSSTDVSLELKPNQNFNYYKDECLILAGGDPRGVLDVYQIHTYANNLTGVFLAGSPFNHRAEDYQLTKPLIIGEFSVMMARSTNWTIQGMYKHGLGSGYAGCWDWALVGGADDGNDTPEIVEQGMRALAGSSAVSVEMLDSSPDE